MSVDSLQGSSMLASLGSAGSAGAANKFIGNNDMRHSQEDIDQLARSNNQTMDKFHRQHKDELGQEDFLRLLVAQVNHQDPMQPQENGEFIAQMAQFGTVDGIGKMQQNLAALTQTIQSGQSLQQASNLVGRAVVLPSDNAYLSDDGKGIKGILDLPNYTNDINVSIYDNQGGLVKTMNLGEHAQGEMDFSWDGRLDNGEMAPAGKYSIRAQGFSAGEQRGLGTLVYAHVDSVSVGQGGTGPIINARGFGQLETSQVRSIAEV